MDSRWSGAKLPFSARDSAAWEKAEQKIQANRRGDVFIRVVDDYGQPLRGLPVRFEQQRHAFRFGVQYPYHAQTYDLLLDAGINAATLWLGWEYVQPERGVYNWEYLDRVWRPSALYQRGLRLTAHALNWFKPGWRVLPQYLLDAPLSELPSLVYEHVGQIARHWASEIETFELANEPFWVDANAIPMTPADMVRICHAASLAVQEVLPNASSEINFAEISRTASYRIRPCDMLETLDRAGVPYHSVGLQSFENACTVTEPPHFYRTKTFTGIIRSLRKYTKFGRPLHISALTVPSVDPSIRPPSRFKLPYGSWDEAKQASYLDAAYTFFFAQPEIEGITWWCPVDGRLALVPNGGLLREDLSPKPAYYALQEWVHRHTSSGQTYTGGEGRTVVKGYAGDYEISVGSGNMGKRVTQQIDARVVTNLTVVLSYNP